MTQKEKNEFIAEKLFGFTKRVFEDGSGYWYVPPSDWKFMYKGIINFEETWQQVVEKLYECGAYEITLLSELDGYCCEIKWHDTAKKKYGQSVYVMDCETQGMAIVNATVEYLKGREEV